MNALSISHVALAAMVGACCLALQAAPVIYPSKGQSAAQTDRDKLACYDWAKAQSGFDPMQAQAAAPQATAQGSTAGMVRGAAGGAAVAEVTDRDPGKGAAVGVIGAGLRERMKQQQAQQQAAQAKQEQRSTFDRAFGACLQGRGYVVR